MNEHAPALADRLVDESLGAAGGGQQPARARRSARWTNPGKSRMRFCSSLSSTSSVMYLKRSGKRGRTENASFASRMQTLWDA